MAHDPRDTGLRENIEGKIRSLGVHGETEAQEGPSSAQYVHLGRVRARPRTQAS